MKHTSNIWVQLLLLPRNEDHSTDSDIYVIFRHTSLNYDNHWKFRTSKFRVLIYGQKNDLSDTVGHIFRTKDLQNLISFSPNLGDFDKIFYQLLYKLGSKVNLLMKFLPNCNWTSIKATTLITINLTLLIFGYLNFGH